MTKSRITLTVIGAILATVVAIDPAGARHCSVLHITDQTPQATINQAIADNWYAQPNDGHEALYSPACWRS